jgi:hypothetical protein
VIVLCRARPRVAPGAAGRLGESLLATWTVAGGLVALVFSAEPMESAVRSAPWLMGPGLWVATALGAGALLRRLPGRSYPGRALAVATVVGGAADALVVAAGHPWPGLVVGVGVFSLAMALLGSSRAATRSAAAGGWATPRLNNKQSCLQNWTAPHRVDGQRGASRRTRREAMVEEAQRDTTPQDVRSHAQGEHFLLILIAPWVLGVLVGVVVSLALGVGMPVAIGSGLAIALGLNFVWVVVVFAIDDGDVNDRVQLAERAGGRGTGEDRRREER